MNAEMNMAKIAAKNKLPTAKQMQAAERKLAFSVRFHRE